MEVGDKLYRFKFDFDTGETFTDVFVITDVSQNGKMLKATPDESNPDTTLHSGITFSVNHFNEVKTSRHYKFVLLDHDDQAEALKLVHEFVSKQLKAAMDRVMQLESWKRQCSEWEAAM